ncbi:hypothetical protein [Saccharicrinis sp. FJH54]|uniref:hypothetical protein n=1 Tax=Saccharicrinis sp. FJH54 TaxID=3344665 RepID=UPI0035D4475A
MNKNVNLLLKIILCLFTTAWCLISCEYSTLKEYYVSIDKPEEIPGIQIILNTNENDSIIFYKGQETVLPINVQTQPGIKLQYAEFYLDDSIISRNHYLDNYYTNFRFKLSDDTVHNFSIAFYTGSGTNSIADINGYEGFVYKTKEYKLICNKKHTPGTGNLNITENGLLLNWKPYNGTGFKNFILTKGSIDSLLTLKENQFIDHEYRGGKWTYDVSVIDNNNYVLKWARLNIDFQIPQPEIKEINKQLALKWSSTEIETLLDGYELAMGNFSGYHYNPDLVYYIPKGVNHFIFKDYMFGSYKEFHFHGIKDNKTSEGQIYNTGRVLRLTMGLPGPYFKNHYDATTKGTLIYDNENLQFYSSKDDSVYTVMPMDADITQSTDGEYIVYPKQSTMDVYQYNSQSYGFVKTIQIKEDISAYNQDLYFKLSDNGILAFMNTAKLYVFDIVNEKLLCSKYMGQLYNVVLMPDGKHLILYLDNTAKVYELRNDTIIMVNEFSSSGNYSPNSFRLIYNEPENIYYFNSYKMIIKNILNSNIEKEIQLGSAFINLDIQKNKILTFDTYSKEFRVFSYPTGELTEIVPTMFEKSTEYMFLCNDRIFRSNYKYYLKN